MNGDGSRPREGRLLPFLINEPDRQLETEPPSRPLSALFPLFLLLTLPTSEVVISLVLLCLLLYGSAMVSGSEVAFFSLTHNDFARLREDQSRQADRILRLKEKPRTLLATILISNNFINIAIVLVSEYMLRTALPDQTYANWASALQEALPFISWPAEYWVRVINFSITVVAVTFLLVLFGEVAPKIYARINNVQLAKAMSGPLVFLVGLFQPLSRLLVRGTSVIERKLEKRRPNGPPRPVVRISTRPSN